MGFRFRKSVNLGGGFRVNFSKSGVGYSWGVKGFRYTKPSKGKARKTFFMPGTGLSYTTSGSKKRRKKYKKTNASSNYYNAETYNFRNVESINIGNPTNKEYERIANYIEHTIILNNLSNFICIAGVVSHWLFLIIGISLKIYSVFKRNINIDCEYDDEAFNTREEAWSKLIECKKIWSIDSVANVSNIKANAGAKTNIKRKDVFKASGTPYYFQCNKKVFRFEFDKKKIFILPDKIVVVSNGDVRIINMDDITINVEYSNMIERGVAPKDAEIVRHTWEYVNKNGQPDKRYKNNKKLPVCKYGKIQITNDEGFNIVLQCSNVKKVEEFKNIINDNIHLEEINVQI